mmetsp:Transcript_101117/g.326371  ORF Transcript_101117/g.326371 Transcript_101117/m.326371 type:complete len:96 (-) Transcript_101117:33-320(-)
MVVLFPGFQIFATMVLYAPPQHNTASGPGCSSGGSAPARRGTVALPAVIGSVVAKAMFSLGTRGDAAPDQGTQAEGPFRGTASLLAGQRMSQGAR